MAAGACPLSLSWYIAYEPTVLPFPKGKQNTLREIVSPFESHSESTILPLAGSIPPRKETGDEHTTAFPLPFPALILLAETIVRSPPGADLSV